MRKRKSEVPKYSSYALVTGAAGGMGRIYAEALAKRGYNLLLVDINRDGLAETDTHIRQTVKELYPDNAECGFETLVIVQDLSEQDAAEKIFAEAESHGCVVDVLVNNAGVLFFNDFTAVPEKKISVMMMVHNYTPVMLCRKFLPGMKERGRGYILNVSSLAAWMPWPGIGMYGNTKRFVKGFSRMLGVECAGTGVSVTAALFGAVDTPLYNLKPSLRKLARRLFVMIAPEKAVERALKATFRRRKTLMPGFINYIFRFFIVIIPDFVLVYALSRVRRIWARNAKK